MKEINYKCSLCGYEYIETLEDSINVDNNPELREELLKTWNKTIIEYTYRKDTRFWIDQSTLKGMNILGKLLMEYRNSINLTWN